MSENFQLKKAIEDGDAGCQRTLQDVSPVSLNDWRWQGASAQHQASSPASLECLAPYLDCGDLDVNSSNARGETALYKTVQRGNLGTVKFLLDRNADVNLCNTDGYTPLHLAVEQRNCTMIEVLLQNGADVNAQCAKKITALSICAIYGHSAAASVQLRYGAQVDCVDEDGNTPLYAAVARNSLEMTLLLLAAGANPCIANNRKQSPLNVAAWAGNEQLVNVQLQKDTSMINAENDSYTTPLFGAIHEGYLPIVKRQQLEPGCGETTSLRKTTQMEAAEAGHQEIMSFFLDRQAH